MTAITYRLKRQVVRTVESPRRLMVVILLLVIVAAAGMWSLIARAPQSIEYLSRYPVATPGAVCPGETFTYPVSIDIKYADSVSRITEGWCREDGICPRTLQNEPYYVNFIDTYGVQTTATRTVPAELTPGPWELRHCNETHTTGLIDVVCYAVKVEVRPDCGQDSSKD